MPLIPRRGRREYRSRAESAENAEEGMAPITLLLRGRDQRRVVGAIFSAVSAFSARNRFSLRALRETLAKAPSARPSSGPDKNSDASSSTQS